MGCDTSYEYLIIIFKHVNGTKTKVYKETKYNKPNNVSKLKTWKFKEIKLGYYEYDLLNIKQDRRNNYKWEVRNASL